MAKALKVLKEEIIEQALKPDFEFHDIDENEQTRIINWVEKAPNNDALMQVMDKIEKEYEKHNDHLSELTRLLILNSLSVKEKHEDISNPVISVYKKDTKVPDNKEDAKALFLKVKAETKELIIERLDELNNMKDCPYIYANKKECEKLLQDFDKTFEPAQLKGIIEAILGDSVIESPGGE